MLIVDTIIQLATNELFTEEAPRKTNRTRYGEDYGINGVSWCVIFIWWLFMTAKRSRLFYGGKRCASCSQLYEWAQQTGQTVPVSEAQRGDILFWNFNGGQSLEHCGIMTMRGIDGYIHCIEGNTPNADKTNDGVFEKLRSPRNLVAVWRPKYDNARDFDGRWSTKAIEETLADGIMTGYPDGSFQPDRAVTREELAQFYTNLKKAWRT